MIPPVIAPRSAPGLPQFDSPAAAAAHYRRELGISGPPPAGAAWRLAEHFGERLKVAEWISNFGAIAMWPDDSATIFLPGPGSGRSQDEREEALLHEIGHLLLTWGCPARMKAWEARGTPEHGFWRGKVLQSEALANGFVAAWRAG